MTHVAAEVGEGQLITFFLGGEGGGQGSVGTGGHTMVIFGTWSVSLASYCTSSVDDLVLLSAASGQAKHIHSSFFYVFPKHQQELK